MPLLMLSTCRLGCARINSEAFFLIGQRFNLAFIIFIVMQFQLIFMSLECYRNTISMNFYALKWGGNAISMKSYALDG